jgi:hypothetical protein
MRCPTGDRGRGTLTESASERGARRLYRAAKLRRPMRRFAVLIALLTPLATAAASPAQAPLPSVPACALGGGDRALRAFYKAELARAERRFGGSRAQRRAFSAAVAAYVYGLPPVAVRQTVQRFPENQLVSIGALVDPDVRTVVFPNVDTSYTVGRLNLAAGPLVIDVPGVAPPARGRAPTRPCHAAMPARSPPASGGSRAPRTWSGCWAARSCAARPICRPRRR